MFDFKSVPLPDYSRFEDGINSVSHAIGVPLVAAGVAMCFHKLGAAATGMQTAALIIYGVSMAIMFFGSGLYHGLKPSYAKRVTRVLDHSNIFIMIAGVLTGVYLLGVLNHYRTAAIALCAGTWAVSLVGILLTFMDLHKFRKVQMAMYLLLGWTGIIGAVMMYRLGGSGRSFFWAVLISGILYSAGAALYGVGKKIRYVHAVFHIFVLAATMVQFYGIYMYML